MNSTESLEEHLRSAQPRLIFRSVPKVDGCFEITASVSEVERAYDEVLSEGFDPDHSPLGPVYWRIIKQDNKRLYLSTFLVTRDQIIKVLGKEGLAYLNPIRGMAVAQLESLL